MSYTYTNQRMKFRERYRFDSKKDFIGKGGFAKVYRAYDVIRKREVALKFYHGSTSAKYDIISEINRMDAIIHPNLIRYYDADIIHSINPIGEKEEIQVGIMEYANAGDIGAFFRGRKTISVTKTIIGGILKGLQHLHDNEIVHRDLKPKNILLSKTDQSYTAKIADFGISKRVNNMDQDLSSQILGSVEYMAPEQFAASVYGNNGKVHTNVDLWAFGIILFELFCRDLPFGSRTGGISYEEILNNILFKDFAINYERIPEPFRTLTRRCLVKNAGERAQSANELLAILNPSNTNNFSFHNPLTNNTSSTNKTSPINPPTPPRTGSGTAVLGNTPDEIDPYDTKVLGDKKDYSPSVSQDATPTRRQYPDQQNSNPSPTSNERKPVRPSYSMKSIQKESTNDGKAVFREPDLAPPVFHPHSKAILSEINVGKNLFKLNNYVESFKILYKYQLSYDFDTESRFYLGYMYYNGKCGGPYDEVKGKALMAQAKEEDRTLVMDLMLKYILNK